MIALQFLSEGFWRCCNAATFCFASNIFNCRIIIKLIVLIKYFPFDYGCIRSTLCTQLYIMIDVPVIILQWQLKMTLAGCILMMCVLVEVIPSSRIFCTLTLIAVFFAVFEYCSLGVYNNMQTMWNIYEIHICTAVVNESEEWSSQ